MTDSASMAAAFAAKDAAELAARYATWAATYDSENASAQMRSAFLA